MKTLGIHTDYFRFKAKEKAIANAEKTDQKEKTLDECLVVFGSVEKEDEKNPAAVAQALIEDTKARAEQLGVKKIVVYPYVHLSSTPGNPRVALDVLNMVERGLAKDYDVIRAPFGWYKEFNIHCLGHPLSEWSGQFGPEGAAKPLEALSQESKAIESEKKLKSNWHIMAPDGVLHDVGAFDFTGKDKLRAFSFYEREKVRTSVEEPVHIKFMRQLELVDYEPASDSGNMRYYPKGKLIKKLLERYVSERTIAYGGVEVETPIMYNKDHPTLEKYLERFPARQYTIESDKKTFFLRFAACFGQFLMAHDANISYKNLPLKLYELTRYSFRREQSGELAGLRRLRAFTMPDVHAICENLEQAMEEYKTRFDLCLDVQKKIGLEKENFEMAFRTTKDFYNNNKKFIEHLIQKLGKPVLLEMWDERKFYFILKYELNFVDNQMKASALSTDQIDIENGERYDIRFVGRDGQQHHPLILHCSPTGAIERVIYALLEKAYSDQEAGKNPELPLWLAPTQIRYIPVSEDYASLAEKMTKNTLEQNIRADFDDRGQSVSKRIALAEKEWIPYIIVIGQREKEGSDLSVRYRPTSKQINMPFQKMVDEIKEKTAGMPYEPLSLPTKLSKRAIFVG